MEHAIPTFGVPDATSESALNDIARLAATIAEMPTALISLVDGDRRWLMGRFGCDDANVPRATTLCAIALANPTGVLAIPDARLDERYRRDPNVADGRIVAYLGAPLVSPDGFALGTLCAFGPQPYAFRDTQITAFELLRTTAMTLLEVRRPLAPINVLQAAVENTNDAIMIAEKLPSGELRTVYANAAFERMLGFTANDLRNVFDPKLWGSEDVHSVRQAIDREESVVIEAVNYRRDGGAIDVEASFTPVRGTGAATTHWVAIRRDVSERRRSDRERAREKALDESRAAIEASTRVDALTGLMNRAAFFDAFRVRYNARTGVGPIGAVFALDLQRFKAVNDSMGNEAGDRVLVHVAHRLRTIAGGEGVVGRIGGDEFALHLPELEDAVAADRFANQLLEALAEPFFIDAREVRLAATIGVAPCTTPGRSATEALRDADLARLRGKTVNGGHVEMFRENLRLDATERAELMHAMEHVVERDELFLEYQPVVNILTGRIEGYEALLRWNHPQLGRLEPSRFIGLAEESGAIKAIGAWVLDEACRETAARSFGAIRPTISVNVSPIELRERGYADRVRATLARVGLPASALQLEITETALLDRLEVATATLEDLRDDGIKVAIDDFGTGYSFLTYLRDLPVDTVKIDRSFVGGLDGRIANPAIVRAVIALAAGFGISVVAEGVETLTQRNELARAGCILAQGYVLGLPAPAGTTSVGDIAPSVVVA